MRMMKTLWLLGAAALALGLSGCGGGGNTRPATTADSTPPAPVTPAAPELDPGHFGAGMVTVENARADDASEASFTFMKGEDAWSEAADSTAVNLTGWSESAVQDAASDPTERIVAYTDIDEATPTAFHEVKGAAPYTVMASDTVVPDSNTDNLPGAPNVSLTFMDDAESEEINEATFGGTLDGANGDFTCTVDPCTLRRVADVGGTAAWALVGGWGFAADDGEMIEVQDGDYLAFGYWNMIDIESLADVVPFYYGSMPYEGNVQALSGAATYNGNAAGGYEHKTYDAGTGEPTSTYGHFTADVRLAAFFGGVDGMSTIDGMVDAFALVAQTGSAPTVDWEVMLERTEVTGQNFVGTNWNGAFFGPSDDGQLPSGVAGGFNATLDNGAVKGAYGATR